MRPGPVSTATGWRLLICAATVASIGTAALASDAELPRVDKWTRVTTENFTLYSNANTSRTAKTAVQLERFRQALGRITRGFDLAAEVPTTMILFKNGVTYERYKRRRDGSVRNVAGFFLPGPFGNYMTLDLSGSSRPMRVVYHEYFHAVINDSLGDLPLWLNEGLAEFFSTFKYRDLSASVEVGHPIESHLRYIAQYGMLPWESFFSTTARSSHYNEGTRQGSFYAQAWLLTHYLNSSDDRMRQLGVYLSGLREGRDEEAAFLRAFGMDKPALGAQIANYLESGGNYLIYDFGDQFGEVETQVQEVNPGEIYYRLGDLLSRAGPREDAERHLDAAKSAGWPASDVDTSRAMAAFLDDDREAAKRRWRLATGEEDSSAEPWFYLALTTVEEDRSRFDPSSTPEAIRLARDQFESGLERQSGHFETLVAYARTFLIGADEPAPAVGAIRLARQRRPLDIDALVVEAALTARAGAVARAFNVIRGDIARRDPDKAEEAEELAVRGILLAAYRQADEGDTEGAETLLEEALDHVRDDGQRRDLQSFLNAFSSGGSIVMTEDDESLERANTVVQEYNAAMGLISSGDYEGAVKQLEKIAEACAEPQICEMARTKAAELREIVAYNSTLRRIKEAVALFQADDIKKSITMLREMEETIEDPELRDMVLQTMKRLGVRPAKKKKK